MSIERNVVIIIPTYNESLVIKETIHQVFAATASSSDRINVLIYDSASTDNTPEIVTGMQSTFSRLYLESEPKKTGLGSAYMKAMRFAMDELKAEIVVEFDADLSHQPQYLMPMLEKLKTNDVVVGSRYIKEGSIPSNWGWHRKLLSKMGNWVAQTFLTFKFKDFTSGFRATHHIALNKALPKQFISNHYAYKLELFWALHKTKAKIVEYPISFIDRTLGESKLPTNSIYDALRVLTKLRLNILKPYVNMCAVGLIGLTLQALVYNGLRYFYSPFISAQCAVAVAICNNFILNDRFTFKKRVLLGYFNALVMFIGYSLLMIGFQSGWIRIWTQYFGTGFLKENLIMILGVALGSIGNYLFYTHFIWHKKLDLT